MINKKNLSDYMKNVVFKFWNEAPSYLRVFAIANCLIALMISKPACIISIAVWAFFVPSAIYLNRK